MGGWAVRDWRWGLRDALRADLIKRIRAFGAGDPLGLALGEDGLAVAELLLRLLMEEADRGSIDSDSLHAVAEFHRVRALAACAPIAAHGIKQSSASRRAGGVQEREARVDHERAMYLYGLLFVADHRRVPRALWPQLIRDTGHDPWQNPLDRATDLIIDWEESKDLVALQQAIDLLSASDRLAHGVRRDDLLGHALLYRAEAAQGSAADRRVDLDVAIELLNAVAVHRETSAVERCGRRASLADAYVRRFRITGEPSDLTTAEKTYGSVLAEAADDSDEHARASAGLGTILGRRAELILQTGNDGTLLLREAAMRLRHAVDTATPERGAAYLSNLGNVMGLRVRQVARSIGAGFVALAVEQDESTPEPEIVHQAQALVDLAARVNARVLPEAEAVRRVTGPEFAMTEPAVNFVIRAAMNIDMPASSQVATLLHLTLRAAEARWGASRESPWAAVADAYVEAVRHSLAEVPNGARFTLARSVVNQRIAMLKAYAIEAPDELAGAHLAAGMLHFKPYMANNPGLSFAGAHDLWLDRQRRQSALYPDDPEHRGSSQMPQPLAATETAIRHLEHAAALASGHERGRTLAALAEARSFLAELQQEPTSREILHSCREAFELIDPARDPAGYLYVLRALTRMGELALPSQLSEVLPMSLAEVRDRYGLRDASSVFAEALALAAESARSDLEAELLATADEELPELSNDAHRRRRWASEVHLLADGRLECRPGLHSAAAMVEDMRAAAAVGDWMPIECAATLVHLAAHTSVDGSENLGRKLIREAYDTAPELWDWHGSALHYLDAGLAYDLGMRAEAAHQWSAAMGHYSAAALCYAVCDQTDLALNSLRRAMHSLSTCDDTTTGPEVVVLSSATAFLRTGDDETVAWRLHELHQALAFTLIASTVEAGALVAVHQAAKGSRFTSTSESPGPLAFSSRLVRELDRVRAGEARLTGPLPDFELPGGTETGMLFYVGSGEAEIGIDDDTAHRNVQRAADRMISEELAAARTPWRLPLIPLDELQALLPPETVLVSLFLGEGRHKRLTTPVAAVHGMAISRERVEHRSVLIGNIQGGLARVYRGGHTLSLTPAAIPVAELRRQVIADPLHRPVTRTAQHELALGGDFLAGFLASLPRWQAEGKRHLCVWPNGPLHYVPFHLLTAGARIVADDWTVTQVPAVGFLRAAARPVSQAADRRRLVAFASATGGIRQGLHEEQALETHAVQVAAAMGGEAVVGTAATRQRFLDTLGEARYVHVAAHGAHNEWAPWFQCLYLTPEGGDDGRVFAHDILRHDLRGIELVTLSSCESALGRFDVNDNLRGLPAAFLSTGALAVIGCLWPVHPQVANDFFGQLYRQLAYDPDRRAAFRTAQRATRISHPAYRDWGAFTFIGDWRTSGPAEELPA